VSRNVEEWLGTIVRLLVDCLLLVGVAISGGESRMMAAPSRQNSKK